MTDITPGDVARYVSTKQAEGLKGWTIEGQMTVLGRIFDHAARHLGWHGTNPVRGLDRDERPHRPTRRRRGFSAAKNWPG